MTGTSITCIATQCNLFADRILFVYASHPRIFTMGGT